MNIDKLFLYSFFALSALLIVKRFGKLWAYYDKNRIGFGIVAFAVLLFTIVSGEFWLLVPFILALIFPAKRLKSLSKYLFVWSIVFFAFIVVLSIVFPDIGKSVIDKSYNSLASFSSSHNAYSLGFKNSNTPLAFLFVIVINGAYIFFETKYRLVYGAIMLVASSILYFFTLSVTAYICILMFLMLYMLKSEFVFSFIKKFAVLLFSLLTVASILLAVNYGQTVNRVNNFLSNRPYTWDLRVSDGALGNIIGNSDNFVEPGPGQEEGEPLDNLYLLLIARYGWIIYFLVLYIYFGALKRTDNKVVTYALFVVLFYFVSEALMFFLVLSILPSAMIGEKLYKPLASKKKVVEAALR